MKKKSSPDYIPGPRTRPPRPIPVEIPGTHPLPTPLFHGGIPALGPRYRKEGELEKKIVKWSRVYILQLITYETFRPDDNGIVHC